MQSLPWNRAVSGSYRFAHSFEPTFGSTHFGFCVAVVTMIGCTAGR